MESLCFTSTLFEIEPGEDEETNPGRYGRQLASWLRERLAHIGYEDAETIPEDWGWCVMCLRQPFMLWVGCGNMETGEPVEDAEALQMRPVVWQCFVEAEVPVLKRLFGKPDTTPRKRKLYEDLRQLLSSEAKIEIVKCP